MTTVRRPDTVIASADFMSSYDQDRFVRSFHSQDIGHRKWTFLRPEDAWLLVREYVHGWIEPFVEGLDPDPTHWDEVEDFDDSLGPPMRPTHYATAEWEDRFDQTITDEDWDHLSTLTTLGST